MYLSKYSQRTVNKWLDKIAKPKTVVHVYGGKARVCWKSAELDPYALKYRRLEKLKIRLNKR